MGDCSTPGLKLSVECRDVFVQRALDEQHPESGRPFSQIPEPIRPHGEERWHQSLQRPAEGVAQIIGMSRLGVILSLDFST